MSSDSSTLLSLLDQHGAELLALFTRLTLNASAAEDLLQDLFLKLRGAKGLARATDRKAYMFRSAMHLAFDWRRAQRMTEPLRIEPALAAEPLLERLIDAEEMEQVLDAVQDLSELGRQTIVLRYLQHQEYAEIARQLGKTEHQVRGLCHKAIEQLQAILRPRSAGLASEVKRHE